MISELKEGWELLRKAYNYRYLVGGLVPYLGLKKARESFKSRHLLDYLERTYGAYPLLSCAGHKYPIVLFPCPTVRITDFSTPVALLKPLDEDFESRLEKLTLHRQFYWLMRSSIPAYNSRTFVMKSLALQGGLKLECGVSTYFDVLRTSYSLEWEILRAFSQVPEDALPDEDAVSKLLPLRNKLHKHVSDPVRDGRGRASGVAVSTLVAYQGQSGQVLFLLRRRGTFSITMRKGLFHVLPSGMFQSQFGDYEVEYNLLHSMLWEYVEEYFSHDESPTRRESSKWFYDLQPVKEMLAYLERGDAELYWTGIAVDLLNLRPEILLLLRIRNDAWGPNHETGGAGCEVFKFNAEWATPEGIPAGQRPLVRIPFCGDPAEAFRAGGLIPGQITPPAAAAVWAGACTLKSLGN